MQACAVGEEGEGFECIDSKTNLGTLLHPSPISVSIFSSGSLLALMMMKVIQSDVVDVCSMGKEGIVLRL